MTNADFERFTDERPTGIKRRVNPIAFPAQSGGVSSVTVPGEAIWRVVVVSYIFLAGGTAGNRSPRVHFGFEGGINFIVSSGVLVPANGLVTMNFYINYAGTNTAAGSTSCPMPDLILGSGEQIAININGFVAGDSILSSNYLVDEVFREPGAPPVGRVSLVDRLDGIEEAVHRLR